MRTVFVVIFIFISITASHSQSIYQFIQSGNDEPATASRATIEAYLAKSITMQNIVEQPFIYNSPVASMNEVPNLLNIPLAGQSSDSVAIAAQRRVLEAIQLIRAVRPKYIHRADGVWASDWMLSPYSGHWGHLGQIERAIHSIDAEIILEAGLFEAVESGIDQPIIDLYSTNSPHVFRAFGSDPEFASLVENMADGSKIFQITPQSMLYDEVRNILKLNPKYNNMPDAWYVPDMSKITTQVWFYYRACKYIDVGFESIHMGRMDIMLKNDLENIKIGELTDKIREYGSKYARRHVVFLNSSVHGDGIDSRPIDLSDSMTIRNILFHPDQYFHKSQVWYRGNPANQQLLWDWGAAAITMVENVTFPVSPYRQFSIKDLKRTSILADDSPLFIWQKHTVTPPYKHSAGGVTPQGWTCAHLPYYVEWDTDGRYIHSPLFFPMAWNYTYSMCDRIWFLSLPFGDRKSWLKYAYKRVRRLDKNAFLVMPGLFWSYAYDPTNPNLYSFEFYLASYPKFDLEDVIKQLWTESSRKSEKRLKRMNFRKRPAADRAK